MLVVPVVVVIKQPAGQGVVLLGKNMKMAMTKITKVVLVLADVLDALVFAAILAEQLVQIVGVIVVMFVHHHVPVSAA